MGIDDSRSRSRNKKYSNRNNDKYYIHDFNNSRPESPRWGRFVTIEKLHELTGLPIGTIRDWVDKKILRATTLDNRTRKIFIDIDHLNDTLNLRLRERRSV